MRAATEGFAKGLMRAMGKGDARPGAAWHENGTLLVREIGTGAYRQPSELRGNARPGTVWVALAGQGSSWEMRSAPPDGSVAEARESALLSLSDLDGVGGDAQCRFTVARGLDHAEKALVRAVSRETLAAVAASESSSRIRVGGAVQMVDALAAGCVACAPSDGERGAWLVCGARSTTVVVVDGHVPAYCATLAGWGASRVEGANEADLKDLLQEVSGVVYNTLQWDALAQRKLDAVTVLCPAGRGADKWRQLAAELETLEDSGPLWSVVEADSDPAGLEMAVCGAGLEAFAEGVVRPAVEFWAERPADPGTVARAAKKIALASVCALAVSYGGGWYAQSSLESAKEAESRSAAELKAAPNPEAARSKAQAEALSLESRARAAEGRRVAAEAAGRDGSGSKDIAVAFDAVSTFSTPGAWLDGLSARWRGERGSTPALSANGGADGREAAVGAAEAVATMGFGRWGATDVGWTGKGWTFRLDAPPDKADGVGGPGRQPAQSTGPVTPQPTPVQPAAQADTSRWGPAGGLSKTLSEGPARPGAPSN